MTKVAIITRTKDRPYFLKRALLSVQSQSFDDYEHLIINDSIYKLDKLKTLDCLNEESKNKIRIINRKKPSNAPDTIFTESVDLSSSEYVVIHDDDDTWHKDFLKLTIEKLDDKPEIGGLVVRTDKIIEKISKDGSIKQLKKAHYMPELKAVSLYRQCIDNQLTPISFIYRRKAYEAVGKYDITLPVCGDWEFGIRFLQKYDVDFLDPGFALANYHHRKTTRIKKGDNSFVNHSHRYYSNKIRNDYLRKELNSGILGVGFIMSQLVYNQGVISELAKKILPSFIVKKAKKRIQE